MRISLKNLGPSQACGGLHRGLDCLGVLKPSKVYQPTVILCCRVARLKWSRIRVWQSDQSEFISAHGDAKNPEPY